MTSDSVLLPYQIRWVEDRSRFKVARMARQSGKSFVASYDVCTDVIKTKEDWVVFSPRESQSLELGRKCEQHFHAFGETCQLAEELFQDTRIKQRTIKINKGKTRIILLPGSPETARGFTANVLFEEHGFHRQDRKTWAAVSPIFTRGYRVGSISTTNGKANVFFDLFNNPEWSSHTVTIYDAVEQGLILNRETKDQRVAIEELRKAINDDMVWRQEFECEFIDEATALLTYDMIAACTDDLCTMHLPDPFLPGPDNDLTLGVDIGRKRDLTVLWLDEWVGDIAWTRAVVLLKGVKFGEQREVIRRFLLLPQMRRACIDATGLGMQLAEELADDYPWLVEPVTFTVAAKEQMATGMLRSFQDKTNRIPADNDIRNDLHSIQKSVTAAGNIRYDAQRSEIGHADRFWARALSLYAMKEVSAGMPGLAFI